jgi:DNA-binding NtrC family response regulator
MAGTVEARDKSAPAKAMKQPDLLIVDDDPSVTELLQLELQDRFTVRAVQGVGDALRAIRCQAPDALVTDLDMDEGGGEHLLAIVKFLHPDVVLVVNSCASMHKLRWVVDSGLAHAACEKSMDLRPLKDTLAELLVRRGVRDEPVAVALGSRLDASDICVLAGRRQ